MVSKKNKPFSTWAEMEKVIDKHNTEMYSRVPTLPFSGGDGMPRIDADGHLFMSNTVLTPEEAARLAAALYSFYCCTEVEQDET